MLYKDEFPDIISTVLKLKLSKRIDPRCKQLVENMNGRFLRTVIQMLQEQEEFEHIFKRLKKDYSIDEYQSSGEKQETIIQWYIELFKTFPNLIGLHQDIFKGLIIELNFDNARLVRGIMFLVCMMSNKNSDYSKKVMH